METLRRSAALEEFFNQNHDPKSGQFSSGRGFGGVSADPIHRHRAQHVTDIHGLDDNERRLLARRTFETTLPGGHRSVIDREETYSVNEDTYYVSGRIQNAHGRNVGFFERVISRDGNELVVNHETFTLDHEIQSMGIGAAFNAHVIGQYRKLGVDKVELHAGYEVGGYAWAREGFRLYPDARHSRIEEFAQIAHNHTEDAGRDGRLDKAEAKQIHSTIDKLVSASARGEDVQPIHVTTIGHDQTHWKGQDDFEREYDTWVGKEAMLGTVWPGVYYFDYGSYAVAASAVRDISPKFRAVAAAVAAQALDIPVEVEDNLHMHASGGIEFACHDASCRPPTSGGTGGSLPGIQMTGGKMFGKHDVSGLTDAQIHDKIRALESRKPWTSGMARTHKALTTEAAARHTFPVITAAQARGDSRPVSRAEFQRLAHVGQAQLDKFASDSTPHAGLDQHWAKIKSESYAEVIKPWGGATIDAHTGKALPQGANAYAITVKGIGSKTVSVHENVTEAEFNAAMDKAKSQFSKILQRQEHHLGVFHDDENHRIDIDPVLVVTKRSDVDTIGAASHAIGGAYNFSDGNGYWPPHVSEG